MAHESAPTTTETAPLEASTDPSTAMEGDLFTSVERTSTAAEVAEDPKRLMARVAERVARLSASVSAGAEKFGDSVSEKRTATEVISDVGDQASELWKGVTTYGSQKLEGAEAYSKEQLDKSKKQLGVIGTKAAAKTVRILTSPARAGEKLAKSMENGLNNIEARAKAAQARKEQRVADRRMNKSIKLQEKQDLRVAKQARREMKDSEKLQAETDKNQAKAERRQAARDKAEAAKVNKFRRKRHLANMKEARRDERADSREARSARNAERAEKVRAKAKRVGHGALKGAGVIGTAGKDVATGMGSLFAEAGREAKEVGSEIYGKAMSAAQAEAAQRTKEYHMNRGYKAAKRAASHLNKIAEEGVEYRVPVIQRDSREEEK